MARARIYYDEAIRRRLPPVCMKCGRNTRDYVTRTFRWYPEWVIVFLLLGALLIWIIVASVTSKRMTVDSPMCEDHRNHWAKRTMFTWVGFLIVIVLGIAFLAIHAAMDPAEPANKEMTIGAIMALSWVGLFLCGCLPQRSTRNPRFDRLRLRLTT